jgi:hypothetical protein
MTHESQQVALKHHSRVFGTRYSPPEVYFDFKKDTLFLDCDDPWRGNLYGPKRFSQVELAQVRYLAIEAGHSRDYGHIFFDHLGRDDLLAYQFRCRMRRIF